LRTPLTGCCPASTSTGTGMVAAITAVIMCCRQLGTWQSVVLVDTNADNPDREVRLSFLQG
jgi:thiamine phosphate synthase YjbQ (UPF0047 family)